MKKGLIGVALVLAAVSWGVYSLWKPVRVQCT